MTKFRPLHDWALIQRLDADEVTAGGIIIPDAAKERPSEGIILAIGPGRNRPDKKDKSKKVFEPTTLKPGQRVIYAKYMVTEIEIDGEEITLVREEDILATVEGSHEIAVKKSYPVRERADHPVTVKGRSDITTVKDKPAKKKKVTVKKAGKPTAKKKVKGTSKAKKKTVKKISKKAAAKKKVKAKKKVTKKATRKKTLKRSKTKKKK